VHGMKDRDSQLTYGYPQNRESPRLSTRSGGVLGKTGLTGKRGKEGKLRSAQRGANEH